MSSLLEKNVPGNVVENNSNLCLFLQVVVTKINRHLFIKFPIDIYQPKQQTKRYMLMATRILMNEFKDFVSPGVIFVFFSEFITKYGFARNTSFT